MRYIDAILNFAAATFLVSISIPPSASLYSLEVLRQQYEIAYFNRSCGPHVLLLYIYR